jgi:L-fucose isomerase-like protein
VDAFLRAVSVADALRNGIRIGVIGQRIDFFWTTIINESELLDRFRVELLPLDMVDFLNAMRERAAENRAAYEAEVAELRRRYTVEGFDSDEPLVNVLAARDEMLALAEAHALDGLALQSFMSMVDAAGAYCTYAESCVGERLPYGAETDVHGVISDLLLRRAMLGSAPAYLAEFTVRHPENDNAVLLWHAAAPLSMCDPADTPAIGHHWILPSPLSGMLHFKLREGPVTVARFDGDHGEYRLAVGEGHTVPGPRTLNNYVWMEVDDWPSWERTLMQGPFIHHCAMGYGHYADALTEACKYVPGLEAVRLGAR